MTSNGQVNAALGFHGGVLNNREGAKAVFNLEGARELRLSTEYLDTGEAIGTYRFADLKRTIELLCCDNDFEAFQDEGGFSSVRDCGFLCVEIDGNDHCRMLVGLNREGREVVALLCDSPVCTGNA